MNETKGYDEETAEGPVVRVLVEVLAGVARGWAVETSLSGAALEETAPAALTAAAVHSEPASVDYGAADSPLTVV